jgi:hypothetical protein
MCFGRLDETELQIGQQAVVVADQGEVHLHAFLDCRIRKPFSHAASVRLISQLLADLRQVVLPVGILDMGQEFSPLAHEMHAAAQQVPCGPHGSGIDIGLGQHAAAEQHRNLMSIDLVIFGLAPMDGLHVQGVSQHKGNALVGAEVGEPIPGEDALDTDNKIFPVGRNGFEERFGGRFHIPVEQHIPLLVQNEEIHGARVQVDATVKFVWFRWLTDKSEARPSSLLRSVYTLFGTTVFQGGLTWRARLVSMIRWCTS